MKLHLYAFTSAALLAAVSLQAGTIWLAPPYSNRVYRVAENGTILDTIDAPQVFGVASNGQNVFFSRSTVIEKRSADGRQVLASFPLDVQYGALDLAWDWTRNRLWVLFAGSRELRQYNPDSGVVERRIPIPSEDPSGIAGKIYSLGLGYDALRDRLYVSFCPASTAGGYCMELPPVRPQGLILSWDARLGTAYGPLLRTPGMTFGVAHSVMRDTLWVVTRGTIERPGYAISELRMHGTYLREIRPDPFNYAHGLDYLPDAPAAVAVGVAAARPVLTGCSGTFDFAGAVKAVGAGTVIYRFLYSDGTATPAATLQFTDAGTMTVSTSLSVQGARSGSVVLEITSPNRFASPPANFALVCP